MGTNDSKAPDLPDESGATASNGRTSFLNSFNHFRGISIVFIVSGHCFDLAEWHNESPLERVISNLIAGGSSMFVFISGFLFHHVFFKRYRYRAFLTAKARNVLLPYVLLSVLPITHYVMSHNPHFDGYFLPQGESVSATFLIPFLKYFATGVFFIPYWYIPFIMAMFVLSPCHMAFIRLNASLRAAITTGLLVVALLVHRPVQNFNLLQSLVYFLPVYLFGIECSIHRFRIYKILGGNELWGLLAVLGVVIWQTLVVNQIGNFNKPALVYEGVDWVLLQKLLVCPLLMVFLHRFETKSSRVLNFLASSSFGIYFIHAWVLAIAYRFKPDHVLGISSYIVWPAFTVGVVALSAGLAAATKRLLGKRSRILIGW